MARTPSPGAAPLCTVALVLAATWAGAEPIRAAALEWNRAAIADGEIWRALTGQLVHWTVRTAAVDLVAVLVLGAAVEIVRRTLFLLSSGLGAVLVGGGLWFAAPSLDAYRGSSGIASALFASLAVYALRRSPGSAIRIVAGLAFAIFLSKTGWELATGQALFSGPLPAGVEVAPAAHLLGAAAGTIAAFVPARKRESAEGEPDPDEPR